MAAEAVAGAGAQRLDRRGELGAVDGLELLRGVLEQVADAVRQAHPVPGDRLVAQGGPAGGTVGVGAGSAGQSAPAGGTVHALRGATALKAEPAAAIETLPFAQAEPAERSVADRRAEATVLLLTDPDHDVVLTDWLVMAAWAIGLVTIGLVVFWRDEARYGRG